MDFNKLKKYSPIIVRIALSLVFLWFGFSQLTNALNWIGWVPTFISSIINPYTVVYINGLLEVTLGLCLLLGVFVRFASLILAIHLLGIASTIGLNEIGIRDFGLSLATFSIFFHGPDFLCLRKGKSYEKD